MRNLKVAAAISAVIGGVSAAHANPTAAQCGAPGATLFVAGSSAAQNAFANALATDLFGGTANLNTYSGTNGNFKAYCGSASATNTAGIASGTDVTVHYRGEGGSVVGVLPIVSGKTVKFLDLTQAACQIAAPVVNGTSATVGTTDGWTGCVTSHAVEMGVSDVEPSMFVGPNYPTAYSTTVFGTASPTALAGLLATPLFQQSFGIYVNTAFNGGVALNLSEATVTNILNGNYSDWSSVPTATGGVVSSTSVPILLVNREAGSGSRAAITAYFLGTKCGTSPTTISDPGPDGYATGDVLTTAAATSGAVTYASIDNTKTGLTLAAINGVTPSNLAAASGQYGVWYEATAQKGTITSTGGTTIYNWLTGGELANVATAPHTAQVNAIPNVGTNLGAVPITSNTLSGSTIYINPFTRAKNSCSLPSETN